MQDVCVQGETYRHSMTIDTFPDNVLLEIFDSCRADFEYATEAWEWRPLAHVCRRWRQIIFASPQRLDLRILCTHGTPVREQLGIWPAFPIVIDYAYGIAPDDEDNIIAALEHPDRVCSVCLEITGPQMGKFATVMQEPFPVLADLFIVLKGGHVPALPTEFLGGSAPHLEYIYLTGIPFPALPTLLLSASGLVSLCLGEVSPTGYISPEAMGACLAALPRLEEFQIQFQMDTPHTYPILPPSVTRAALPALTSFRFEGAGGYLEDLVSRIDGPQLDQIDIFYFNQLVDIQVAQLSKFVDRSVRLSSTLCRHAYVRIWNGRAAFTVCPTLRPKPTFADWRSLRPLFSCDGVGWHVSHITHVLSQFSTTLSNVVHLTLENPPMEDRQIGGTEGVEWLHFFHRFPTAQTLHVSRGLSRHVALALEDITGKMVTEVLPSLDLIYLVGQPASSIEKFVAARRLSGFPVTVFDPETEFYERLRSYGSG